MNNAQRSGLKAIIGAVTPKHTAETSPRGFGELAGAFFNTENAEERQKLLEDFKARQLEFAEFLANNPELLNTEAEKALLSAISAGNANAALKYLERRDPEKWGDDTDTEEFDSTITIVRAGKGGQNG